MLRQTGRAQSGVPTGTATDRERVGPNLVEVFATQVDERYADSVAAVLSGRPGRPGASILLRAGTRGNAGRAC